MWRYILLTLFLLWQSCGILAHHRFQWKYQHVWMDSVTGTNIQLKEEMFLLPGIIWKDSMGFSLKIKYSLIGPQLENSGIRDLIFMRVYDNNPRPDIRIVIDGQPINMVSQASGREAMDLHLLFPELLASYRKFELDFSLENILGAVWDITQIETESSIVNDPEPFLELHYTSEIPFYVKCTGTYFF